MFAGKSAPPLPTILVNRFQGVFFSPSCIRCVMHTTLCYNVSVCVHRCRDPRRLSTHSRLFFIPRHSCGRPVHHNCKRYNIVTALQLETHKCIPTYASVNRSKSVLNRYMSDEFSVTPQRLPIVLLGFARDEDNN